MRAIGIMIKYMAKMCIQMNGAQYNGELKVDKQYIAF